MLAFFIALKIFSDGTHSNAHKHQNEVKTTLWWTWSVCGYTVPHASYVLAHTCILLCISIRRDMHVHTVNTYIQIYAYFHAYIHTHPYITWEYVCMRLNVGIYTGEKKFGNSYTLIYSSVFCIYSIKWLWMDHKMHKKWTIINFKNVWAQNKDQINFAC